MHPIGLRHFHDVIPLPLSRKREEDLYYFLAQASLRKLLMETLDVVGHQSMSGPSEFDWFGCMLMKIQGVK